MSLRPLHLFRACRSVFNQSLFSAAGEGMELMTSHDDGSIHVWKPNTEGHWEEYASIDPTESR